MKNDPKPGETWNEKWSGEERKVVYADSSFVILEEGDLPTQFQRLFTREEFLKKHSPPFETEVVVRSFYGTGDISIGRHVNPGVVVIERQESGFSRAVNASELISAIEAVVKKPQE